MFITLNSADGLKKKLIQLNCVYRVLEERTEEIFGSHFLRLQRVTDAVHVLSRDPHDVLPALC